MPTNSGPNQEDKSASDKNDLKKNDDDPAMTPKKKLAMTPDRKPIGKSASLSDLDGSSNMNWKTPTDGANNFGDSSNLPWKTPTDDPENLGGTTSTIPWKTPDEDEIDPMEIRADDEEKLLFPPPHLANSVMETPIQSNVRRKLPPRRKSNVRSRSDGDPNFEKSVSFGRNIQGVEEEIVEEVFGEKDDVYGHFCTSSYEESPDLKQQLHKSFNLDQAIVDENKAFGDTSYVFDSRKDKLAEEPNGHLSLPELAISKQRISFKTRPGHRRFNSNISEISLDSDVDSIEDVAQAIQYDNNRRMVQMNSNRRLSLTVDMETGRSPNRSSKQFHRGQQAMRRIYSSEMLDAQSPRVRRRRAMSYNLDQFRKGLSKRLSLPSPKSFTDLQKLDSDGNKIDVGSGDESKDDDDQSLSDHSRESLRSADRRRRKRYNVEQVEAPNGPQSRSSKNEVQYRLSAITPIELRRRRYRNSLTGSVLTDEKSRDVSEKTTDSKKGDSVISAEGKCNQCLAAVANILIEVVIFILSKTRENSSVGVVNKILYWSFRRNFFIVLTTAACSFYVCTVLFAVFIYLLGRNSPQCIHVNGVDFGETRTQFVDAFALSWTTFTTVGYGLVFPGTSATMDNSGVFTCFWTNVVTTFEAFAGILFAGFWGAIWFAKVTRVSSFAQVSFSDAIIVKYGTGVTGVVEDEEYGSSDDDEIVPPARDSYRQSKLPCPIFEFRIANRLHRQKGGEIIDACLNIVASMEESQSTRLVQNGAGMEGFIRRKGRRPKRSSSKKLKSPSGRSLRGDGEDEITKAHIKQAQQAARTMVASHIDIENKIQSRRRSPTPSQPFPNQIFAKLQVESLEHPFFKRVWNVRHVLDVTSPLLKPEAKELMRINNGHWPEELNNATAVRASIQFDQILVSFSGTSNVDANSVYSQNAYKFEDMCVGYAFCNMLFREANGDVGVDHSLLNDVKEQSGGGGEELHYRDQESSTRSIPDIFIL